MGDDPVCGKPARHRVPGTPCGEPGVAAGPASRRQKTAGEDRETLPLAVMRGSGGNRRRPRRPPYGLHFLASPACGPEDARKPSSGRCICTIRMFPGRGAPFGASRRVFPVFFSLRCGSPPDRRERGSPASRTPCCAGRHRDCAVRAARRAAPARGPRR